MKTKKTSFLARAAMMLLVMVLTTTTAWAQAPATIGTISYNSTLGAYEIKTKQHLKDLRDYVCEPHDCEGLTFKMTADITYESTDIFYPIGENNRQFKGTFDGQGHTISGINNNNTSATYSRGIFFYLSGTVKNLVVSNCSFAADQNIGAIADQLLSGTIENCRVENNVTLSGNSYIGGIVGSCNEGTIKGCTSAATITGTKTAGTVKAKWIGGIAGHTSNSSKLTDNIFTGTISGDLDYNIGAIVGENASGDLTNNLYTSTGFGGIGAPGSATAGADGAGARKALTISAADGVTITPTGTATTYNVSGITVYADNSGMGYASKFYAGATEAAKLTIAYTVPEGYTFGGYAASNGGTISGNATDGYTLTMPAKDATVTAILWSGDGSADHPYIISNTDQLDVLAQRVNAGNDAVVNGFSDKYFKLGDNIAYDKNTANNFTPIGDNDHIFYGTFDGDGKTISGININSGSARGIFGRVGGTVKNLVVSNCSIVAYQNIGAIAGVLYGTIENCHVDNVTLSGNSYAGGIVGNCEGGTIKGCTCAATITGIEYSGWNAKDLGGIVGATTEFASTSSKLTDNIFTGTITGSDDLGKYIGAIVGKNNSGTLLTNNLYTSTGFGGIVAEGSTTGADDAGARQALTISAADGVTITPTGTATTYDVSGITVYADNSGMGYDSKFYAGATDAVKLTIAYTVPEGYTFGGYAATNGGTISGNATDGFTLTMPAANVTVTPTLTPIEYTLQYNGADGATFATANPTTYTVESDAITLTNPTKDGYTFAGWTGTGLTEATTTVTIAKGSTGNREYTATWSLADYTITYDLAGGTLAEGVSNPTGYNIDSDDITLNNPTREGYTFAGWTGTGLTEATTTVTIAKGSHENKTFTATWEKNPDTRYVVDADGVAVTTMAYLAELALDDTMQDYVEKGKLKATVTPKNKYWTLACGVDLLLPEGVKVYKARMNSAGTKVELTEIDAATLGGVLKANNGVLLSGTAGKSYDLVVSPNNSVTTLSNADAKSYGTDNELEPVLEDTHFTTEDYFILTENKFIMVDISKDTKVPAGKAVLKVAAGSAKTRTLDVIDGETTGISSAVNSADDEVWYNLQGQRISKPTRKGVYILNGKKVRK